MELRQGVEGKTLGPSLDDTSYLMIAYNATQTAFVSV